MSVTSKFTRFVECFLGLLLMITACIPVESGPHAWIDHPLEGALIPAGEPATIISHAYAKNGLGEVVLSINGEAYRRDLPVNPGESFSQIQQEWIPETVGVFTLQITAYSLDGETIVSEPVSVRVESAKPQLPVATTPVGIPDLAIVSVDAVVVGEKGGASICNTRVVYTNLGDASVPFAFNIQYQFNGVTQSDRLDEGGLAPGSDNEIIFDYPYEGMPYIGVLLDSGSTIVESDETNNAFAEIRLCGSGIPSVTLTRSPTIAVPIITTPAPVVTTEVVVATTQPPPDTMPPKPPTPTVPANGLEIACKGQQTLAWLPSSDPSGIARYELRLERRPNLKSNWKQVNVWNKIKDKQLTVTVECGYYYRWSIRAVDGAGNFSNWSAWSTFAILLS
jgi:hypothetical protein